MNLTQTVRAALVCFLLLSGFFQFTFASPRLRRFILLRQDAQNEGQRQCLEEEASLATLYDYDDVEFVEKLFPIPNVGMWVSLKMTRVNFTTWSDGAPYTFKNSNETVSEMGQTCEAIVNGTWIGYNCSEKMDFMCSIGNNYSLIEGKKKNWCQAQQYCRTHFSDLASITSEDENQRVIETGGNKTFWIGLMHDKWEWENGICSTYRKWSLTRQGECVIQLEPNAGMQRTRCGVNKEIVCSKGTVRIITVNETYTWERALDYCNNNHTGLLSIRDSHDMKAVAQHLNVTNVPGPFWIGLRQSFLFGFWIWKDRVVTDSNWKDGITPEPPMSQLCAVIHPNENNTWTDENCFLKHHFLCEEEVSFNRT